MPPNSFLVVGDQVLFENKLTPSGFLAGPAITVVTSNSKNTSTKRGHTVEGDEARWMVVACPYQSPPFTIPGVVMCKIKKLDASNIAPKIKENKKSILLVGNTPSFIAEFTVTTKASLPPPAAGQDPVTTYMGRGQFIQAANSKSYNKG